MKKFLKRLLLVLVTMFILFACAVGYIAYGIVSIGEIVHDEAQAQKIERWVKEAKEHDKALARKHPHAKKHVRPLRPSSRRVVCEPRAK